MKAMKTMKNTKTMKAMKKSMKTTKTMKAMKKAMKITKTMNPRQRSRAMKAKAMKAQRGRKRKRLTNEPEADFALLHPPYANFVREMWNSRDHMRLFMHTDKTPQCQLKWCPPSESDWDTDFVHSVWHVPPQYL